MKRPDPKKNKKEYSHSAIESKWQKEWEKKKIYQASNTSSKKKFFGLIEFPYPSGAGLHVGHPRPYIGMDIISRKRRMEGHNVLYPIGWDAFGLPTENYAIKTGIHPEKVTKTNSDTFRRQIKMLGASFDWSREINTTDPAYYKWTQWLFLKFFEKGLAYKSKSTINWCPSCKIGLANEEVIDGTCERCGGATEKREKEQWMLAITKYAERLDKDLDLVDYPHRVKAQQRNWIGKSEGSEIDFKIKASASSSNKILIGTRNEAKVKMIKECMPKISGVQFVSLNDIDPVDDSALVEGPDFEKNARMKAQFYFEKTGIPTVSTDNVFWLEKWKKNNGIVVHMRKEANPKSDRATDEEVIAYLKKWVAKAGGQSKAHFEYALAFADAGGVDSFVSVQRGYILQGKKESKTFWPGYPTESLLIDEKTKIFKADQPNDVRYSYLIEALSKKAPAWFAKADSIKVFTTRADTLFGVTYVVLAPEHPLVAKLLPSASNKAEVSAYVEIAKSKTEMERTAGDEKTKTGVPIKGVKAINPANGEEVPVWVADYVLPQYGTGAVMAVPAHDERDFEFAKKHGLPMKHVVFVGGTMPRLNKDVSEKEIQELYQKDGTLYDSGKFDGMDSEEARKKITEFVGGKIVTKFKLRDWVFSRQRYWGEPIPLVYCESCANKKGQGWVPVPEKELPLKLPKVKSYKLTDTGESPLANITKWVNTKCPVCKGPARRETDTMPNWAGSSWYYLRYTDDKNKKEFASKKALKYWMKDGVNWYNGGMEHTTLHLLYSRFWHKFFYDIKLVPTSEPYMKRTSHGMILAEGGEKMSKSKGNVVNPDEIVKNYGADTLRVYEMFMGPFDQAVAWSSESIIGPRRFLERTWKLSQRITETKAKTSDKKAETAIHKTIKKVGEDIETMAFNTCVSSMMVCLNELEKNENISAKDFKMFLQVLAPFAPHMAEELWFALGEKKSIHISAWPKYDPKKIIDSEIKIAIQINGKVRAEMTVPADLDEAKIREIVIFADEVKKHLENKAIKRFIYVKNKLVNIVI